MKKSLLILIVLTAVSLMISCSSTQVTLDIISGSENKSLEPILAEFAKDKHIEIAMHYKGSVDMMQIMQTAAIEEYDAVWPANSIWISLGDDEKRIKHERSIMTSPIVFAIKKSSAEALGFIDRDVYTQDILQAINDKKLKFIMTSATQSNSGACAYLGFLSALLDNPASISTQDLDDEALRRDLKALLAGVNRSSGSSGWLKDLYLSGDYQAMVNYEAMVIEANQVLTEQGKEPLYAIYPVDGLAVADSPLGYVDKGDQSKEALFLELQEYLLSEAVQSQLSDLGRRTGIAGIQNDVNPAVFNSDWGIDGNKLISGITMPSAPVIEKALDIYQTALKKPSYVVYCLDFSGSMEGNGEREVKDAMTTLLDQTLAAQNLIKTSSEDVIVVMPFSDYIHDIWTVSGNQQGDLNDLLVKIKTHSADGGTDIYTPAMQALDILKDVPAEYYTRSVVLLTDGETNNSEDYEDFAARYQSYGQDIPVFSIAFGSASYEQLEQISDLTLARVFDGKADLIKAFKKAKGYQ